MSKVRGGAEPNWFEGLPVVGRLSESDVVELLRSVGDLEAATAVERGKTDVGERNVYSMGSLSEMFSLSTPVWRHTAHTFGYIAPNDSPAPKPIIHASSGPADSSLRDSRIRITLDALRVADYPGAGEHRILFDFYARNQLAKDVEHLHFNSTFRVREGERAAVLGYPIFDGLNVGPEGVAFKCFTVNVGNADDEAFLGFLESNAFKGGLKLLTHAQPALAPFSQMAFSITQAIARRNRNVPVQDFYLGLDFTTVPSRARLAEGSYVAVQVPEEFELVWEWAEWVLSPTHGQIVRRDNPRVLIPYNYVVFGVSRLASV
jgi:hypothetical protein